MISYERVREVLRYDPETGVFTWLVRVNRRVRVGDVAGTDSRGYWRIKVDHRNYPAHILAWFYVTGAWPTHEVDHIDGDPLNNAFVNLRDEPHGVNQSNIVAPQKNNHSGFRGVHRGARGGWQASISVGGKKRHLGYFATPEEASAAYWVAKAELHGEESYRVRLDKEQST